MSSHKCARQCGGYGDTPISYILSRVSKACHFLSNDLPDIFVFSALAECCDLSSHIMLLQMASKYHATCLLRRIMVLEHHFLSTLDKYNHF